MYKSLKDLTPAYLKNLLVLNFRRGGLRNNIDARKLIVSYVKTGLSVLLDRDFGMAYQLMSDLIQNIESFKIKLKTHLFKLAFNLGSDYIYY